VLVRQQLKLADSQQLVVSTFLRGTWASVCVSYFFVPVETVEFVSASALLITSQR
jgi:hypothetical protein